MTTMTLLRIIYLWATLLLPLAKCQTEFEDMLKMSVGCFRDDVGHRDLEYEVTSFNGTVAGCVASCGQLYFKYAGLQNGGQCFCGGSFGRYGTGECDMTCSRDPQAGCGGSTSNTVFRTGVKVPRPPQSLNQKDKSTHSMEITWGDPNTSSEDVDQYYIRVALYFSYNPDKKIFLPKLLKISNTSRSAKIAGLLAGSQYNVSVSAVSKFGEGPAISQLFWTELGTPRVPKAPAIIKDDQDKANRGIIHVQLQPVEEYEGPITSYEVIVIDETFPTPFSQETLYGHDKAVEEGLTYWIAAVLDPSHLVAGNEFYVGDNKLYGGYQNYGPLTGRDYHISLAAVSSLNGLTKKSFAKVSHDQHHHDNMIVFKFEPEDGAHNQYHEEHEHPVNRLSSAEHTVKEHVDASEVSAQDDNVLETGLIAAIVVVGLLLLAAVLLFVGLKYSLFRRRRPVRRLDTQELTTNFSVADGAEVEYVDNNSYEHEDNIRSAEEHLASLTKKVWQIPRNFVEINSEVLGRGKFGTVMKGSVLKQNVATPCCLQVIPNRLVSDADKTRMLKDLDLNIKASMNNNIVNLVGICEEKETTIVVVESAELQLKQFLLDSRALATHPSYAQKTNRFATVQEDVMVSIMSGIGNGLFHLASHGIQHSRICARAVFLSHGYQPKIGGFGMSNWERPNENMDPTRWLSPEAQMSRQVDSVLLRNSKGTRMDVWSYGCLLWEMATLGATPYAEVSSKEVLGKIMRGSRLPRTRYMSESLFQLMLLCWMTDPDERPEPAGLCQSLSEIIQQEQNLLNFNLYPGFQYEPYLNELEVYQN